MVNTSALAGLIFFLAFAGMILLHELGHFLAARFFGIEVEEFGFGLPPKMFSLFHWKETEFTLNWLPIGGFVRPKGENDPNVPGGLAAANPWKRLGVLFAGPVMNLLTGLIVFIFLVRVDGYHDMSRVQLAEIRSLGHAGR
jgi:regulator of sigma E protease